MLLRLSGEVADYERGQESGNSVTDWPFVFATQMWVPPEVMASGSWTL